MKEMCLVGEEKMEVREFSPGAHHLRGKSREKVGDEVGLM